MSLFAHGSNTSEAEVTHISSHGIWLLSNDQELFLPYTEFPWFKDQPVKAIIHVEESSPGHFYWPDIEVDLTLEAIQHPGFPLKAKVRKRIDTQEP